MFGFERGFCLMVGGEENAVARLAPLFPRTGARRGRAHPRPIRRPRTRELGVAPCGPAGAGHFVKMVHNGIEYGLMAAWRRGLNLLHHANAARLPRASGTPRQLPSTRPEHYR